MRAGSLNPASARWPRPPCLSLAHCQGSARTRCWLLDLCCWQAWAGPHVAAATPGYTPIFPGLPLAGNYECLIQNSFAPGPCSRGGSIENDGLGSQLSGACVPRLRGTPEPLACGSARSTGSPPRRTPALGFTTPMMMIQRVAAVVVVGMSGAQAQYQQCVGDVCVGPNIGTQTPNWAKTPFDRCPTAAEGGCGLPASSITRETRCEKGTGSRTAGLASWMPVEYPQTDASLGGILTYKEVSPPAGLLHHSLRAPPRASTACLTPPRRRCAG